MDICAPDEQLQLVEKSNGLLNLSANDVAHTIVVPFESFGIVVPGGENVGPWS